MSRGFLIFAYNNEQIDYAAIALCNAMMIKANLSPENKVCLVTSEGMYNWLVKSRGKKVVSKAFDDVVFQEPPALATKKKCFDTLSTVHELPWHNTARATAYATSPYDETILIDADYLVMDKTLDGVWGSEDNIRINSKCVKINQRPIHVDERRLEPFGIDMFWATCVYFRKSDEAKILFDLVEHIRENYAYYQHLYRFPGKLFRNDYAFSIALHVMSNWIPGRVASLPAKEILTSFDCDELIDVPAKNEFVFLINDEVERYKFTVSKVKGVNIHVMNKFAIVRQLDKIISLYGKK